MKTRYWPVTFKADWLRWLAAQEKCLSCSPFVAIMKTYSTPALLNPARRDERPAG
jgi:hypothetical protein